MRRITLATAALLALLAHQPAPVHAQGTAAWAAASSWCRARAAGLDLDAAARVAVSDNWALWGDQMTDPSFRPLFSAEIIRQCYRLLLPQP